MPWSDRLLPFIVVVTIFFSGMLLPATSVIQEKEKRTLVAVSVTPATLGDIFLAKGIFAFVLSGLMGFAILVLNQAFGYQPGILILVLALGALMAATLGLILGAYLSDTATLFMVWKTAGIVLFAPPIVYMFPKIPQWIGKVFPTYYMFSPIMAISRQGGGWSDVLVDVIVLAAIDVALILATALVVRDRGQKARL